MSAYVYLWWDSLVNAESASEQHHNFALRNFLWSFDDKTSKFFIIKSFEKDFDFRVTCLWDRTQEKSSYRFWNYGSLISRRMWLVKMTIFDDRSFWRKLNEDYEIINWTRNRYPRDHLATKIYFFKNFSNDVIVTGSHQNPLIRQGTI